MTNAHRTLLRRTAIGCLGASFVGALPYALVAAGVLHVDAGTVEAMALVHAVTGEYGGPGYIALLALLALRLSAAPRGRALLGPVIALGQRSLSGYLFQSVSWLALFSPWALHLGGTYAAVVAGLAVWAVSLAGAQAMSAVAYRGPAETLLRWITYRPARRPAR
ncbi:DUF418 domain-containing protein [Micromonospora sp. NPDC049559]|uniref:DUF418 domain-containing protein n=1 Tax=Micromonospora sp. NPDC049559 TaxID=3155923 RepID=UPI00343CB088